MNETPWMMVLAFILLVAFAAAALTLVLAILWHAGWVLLNVFCAMLAKRHEKRRQRRAAAALDAKRRRGTHRKRRERVKSR